MGQLKCPGKVVDTARTIGGIMTAIRRKLFRIVLVTAEIPYGQLRYIVGDVGKLGGDTLVLWQSNQKPVNVGIIQHKGQGQQQHYHPPRHIETSLGQYHSHLPG